MFEHSEREVKEESEELYDHDYYLKLKEAIDKRLKILEELKQSK